LTKQADVVELDLLPDLGALLAGFELALQPARSTSCTRKP